MVIIMKKIIKSLLTVLAVTGAGAALAGAVGGANAGDFQVTLTLLTDWTQGTLGQMIALAMVVVGVIGGIARQSLMAFVIGIGGGMGLSFAPAIIQNVFAAGLPLA